MNLVWRKSTFSGDSSCVEVADLPGGGWMVRDSTDPDGGNLRFTAAEVEAFRLGVKAGEFD